MVLETLPFSFKMDKGILKYYRVSIWKSKVLYQEDQEQQHRIRKVQEKE